MLVKRFGKINILVNNVGIVYYKGLLDTTEERWDKTIDTNLKGIFLIIKELSHIIKNKIWRCYYQH
jgi:NAD(P)-dependent dehydrogenase (short-subunit alcohol dehydrogenase family)